MNVSAMLSMQNLGQISQVDLPHKLQEGENGTLFSSLFSNALRSEESVEVIDPEMMQLLKLLQVLQEENIETLETKEFPEIQLKNILSEAGITDQEFLKAVETLMQGIVKEVPQLKEELLQAKGEEGEEDLIQLLETLSVMSVDSLKKMDQPSLELLLKTSKVYEHSLRHTDLNHHQAEKAEILLHNLKNILQKLEQHFNGTDHKHSKWNGILEKVYNANLLPKNEEAVLKNGFQHSLLNNKSVGEGASNPIYLNGRAISIQTNSPNSIDVSGEGVFEGERAAKGNGTSHLTGLSGGQAPRIEQFSLMLNKSQNGTNYEQFVKDFANIMARSQMTQTPNMSKLLLKLYPEQLGSVRVEILQQNGVMTARILASTKTAKDILDSQLTGLRQALAGQNLQIEKIEVAQTLTESNRQERQSSSQQQNGQQPREQSRSQQSDNENSDTTFKELLMNSEV
ncbi:MAG: flagellar hook-length control protein FliK [Bacillota bacterium]